MIIPKGPERRQKDKDYRCSQVLHQEDRMEETEWRLKNAKPWASITAEDHYRVQRYRMEEARLRKQLIGG